MIAMVARGRFAWIGGGRHLTVDDPRRQRRRRACCSAPSKGRPAACTSSPTASRVVFRDFVTRAARHAGREPPDRTLPAPVASAVATVGETAWRLLPLPGRPPLTRLADWLSALEATIDITRARTELGYAPVRTIDEGLEELRQP